MPRGGLALLEACGPKFEMSWVARGAKPFGENRPCPCVHVVRSRRCRFSRFGYFNLHVCRAQHAGLFARVEPRERHRCRPVAEAS
eukprot:8371597-Alexandrium_andersonii.AAC.1